MINDLVSVDKLSTRILQDGTLAHLQVMSGPTILLSRTFINATQTQPSELENVLANMVDDVIRGQGVRTDGLGVLTDAAGKGVYPGYTGPNTLAIVGDSIADNHTHETNKWVNASGVFNFANALLGNRFIYAGKYATGGLTAAQVLAGHIQTVINLPVKPKYAYLSVGANDLYAELVTGDVAASRILACVQALLDAGIIPIWSTIAAVTHPAAVHTAHMRCNDLLRQAAANRYLGLFFDLFKINQEPLASVVQVKEGWTYDGIPYAVHPNNVCAYYMGKALAAGLVNVIPDRPNLAWGPDTAAISPLSNLLNNAQFIGTGGVAGTGVTGTVPAGWTVEWVTRSGTGTCAVSVVDITDPATGVVVGKGARLTMAGAIAAWDTVRIRQTSTANANISGGDTYSGQAVVAMSNPANVRQLMLIAGANGAATMWGNNAPAESAPGSFSSYPEAATLAMQTLDAVAPGTGAANTEWSVEITFTGVNTGQFTISNPRFRKL